jgi:hypothetical protein
MDPKYRIDTYIHYFVNTYILHRKDPDPIQTTCLNTQMFLLSGNRTSDLLRNKRVFTSLRQISRQKFKAWSCINIQLHNTG